MPSARGFGAGDAPSRVGSRGRASVGCPCAGWRVMALLFYVGVSLSCFYVGWLAGCCSVLSLLLECFVLFIF